MSVSNDNYVVISSDWRQSVVRILRSGDNASIIRTNQADSDWRHTCPDAWPYQRHQAMAEALEKEGVTGRHVTDMEPPCDAYEFLFYFERRKFLGKNWPSSRWPRNHYFFKSYTSKGRQIMNAPVPGWVRITSREPVYIPNATGDDIAETLWIDVPAWKDPKTDQIFLDGEANDKLDTVKARYMGILAPNQLRDLRNAIGVTQKGMAELLQLGEKSWTRWESGSERPSRSMNVFLCAVYDGKVDVNYLRSLADSPIRSQFARWKPSVRFESSLYQENECYTWSANESTCFAA